MIGTLAVPLHLMSGRLKSEEQGEARSGGHPPASILPNTVCRFATVTLLSSNVATLVASSTPRAVNSRA